MNTTRLQEILDKIANVRIAVFGDFFLDKYLEIDPALNEKSIETGLTAYQVTGKRLQPGAAGTVTNNLSALEVGTMYAVGAIGDDGEGYDLQKALRASRVDTSHLTITNERFTPTYTKPMLQNPDGESEMERQDIKNRTNTSPHIEELLTQQLREVVKIVDAVIIADQVQERNCGSVTDAMRGVIKKLAEENETVLFFADSREYIDEFESVVINPKRYGEHEDVPTQSAIESAQQLRGKIGKDVFLTLDKEGICPITKNKPVVIPCPPVTGPVDIVGAGDSVTAGIVSSLAAGATEIEAAIIGNLVASVTIRQLGTTGTASPQQVMEAWHQNESIYRTISG
jgi:bifunctional ADP-heptose synthase (sugar kinase/adenylyltransferase)